MDRQRWACDDCGWPWPLAGSPPEGAECDNCGGPLGAVGLRIRHRQFHSVDSTIRVARPPRPSLGFRFVNEVLPLLILVAVAGGLVLVALAESS
jgi:hypothetical protein